jgi:hypothetical protein
MRLSHHFSHYFSLFGILGAGLVAFLIFSYDRTFQISVIAAVSFAYVIWGVIHHYLHKDLYFSVILEYVIVAALGFFIVYSLIFRV